MKELENYKKEILTIDLVKANLFAVLMVIPVIILFGLPYFLIWKPQFNLTDYLDNIGLTGGFVRIFFAFVIMVLGIVVHELIHGITWAIYAKNGFKSIKIGVLWKMLTPYCHCKEILTVRQFIIGAITPAIFMGFFPSIIAILMGNLSMLIFGMFFIMAAGGDLMTINLLRKENSSDFVQDHPTEAGCFIYRKIE